MPEPRTCRRTGCRWPAAASLAFRYATREAWLARLTDEQHPTTYDLCPQHADAVTVPRGWEIVDDRPAPSADLARTRETVPSRELGPIPGNR